MRVFPSILLAGVAACACLHASHAFADSPAPAARAADLAQQAAREGREGRWQNARDAYRAAWAIERSHDIAAELGLIELRLDHMREAAEYLSYSLSTFPATGTGTRRRLLEERFATARAKVAALAIEVSEPGAQILVDGHHAGISPLSREVFVDPGTIEVTAKKEGYTPARAEVPATEGGSERVILALKRDAPLPAPASRTRATAPPKALNPPPVKGYERPLLYSMAGVWGVTLTTGTALLVAGAYAHEDATKLRETLILKGGAPATCAGDSPPAECAELRSRLDTSSDLIWGGIGVLGAAGTSFAATAIYGLVLHTRDQPQGSLHIVPIVTAQQRTVSIAGIW